MNQQKFNTWLKLWRLGLAPDPEIVSTILDVSTDETEFYERVSKKAEELAPFGLISGTKGLDDPLPMSNQYWIGPDEVTGEFTAFVNLEITKLKRKYPDRFLKENVAYMGFRYWAVSGGERPLDEWRNHWEQPEIFSNLSVN
jgi:hypothetical protein